MSQLSARSQFSRRRDDNAAPVASQARHKARQKENERRGEREEEEQGGERAIVARIFRKREAVSPRLLCGKMMETQNYWEDTSAHSMQVKYER